MSKLYRFEQKSYDAKRCAQLNLVGRTHYVDDATLKCFSSRILKTVISDDGLLLALVESYKGFDDKRLFRPVVFNILGWTIDRPDMASGFKTKAQAIVAMWDALNNINAIEHTKKALASHLESETNNVNRLLAELV